MTAVNVVRKPDVVATTAAIKRKVSDEIQSSSSTEPPKKKSPLYNRPQNHYVPAAPAPMTKEQISEWRKEQRRERNRESAAASRNKIRSRIDELEGEVQDWKSRYEEMETKMKCMERHIDLLTKLVDPNKAQDPIKPMITSPVICHPSSSPSSPVMSSSISPKAHVVCTSPIGSSTTYDILPPPLPDFSPYTDDDANVVTTDHLTFPPLFSEPHYAQVEKTEAATLPPPTNAAAYVFQQVISHHQDEEEESKKEHIIPISRHAVLIAGATVDFTTTMMTDDKMIDDKRQLLQGEGEEEQLLGLPKHDPMAKRGVVDEFGVLTSGQGIIEGMVFNELKLPPQVVVTTEGGEGSTSDLSSDDEDFLDLLVDTLDCGDFDPELFV